jgi:ATP-binding cassette subfamily F protein uup
VPVAEPAPVAVRTPSPRKLSFKQQRELDGMESAILTAEMRVAELEKTLNDHGFYVTRAKEAPSLIAELDAAKAEVSRLYTRWSELDQIAK